MALDLQRITALRAQATSADQAFEAARPRAQAAMAAAAGSRPGEERWSNADLALAEMERARGNLGIALASIEAIYAADRLAHPGDALPNQVIARAREAIIALADAQDRLLDQLRGKLP